MSYTEKKEKAAIYKWIAEYDRSTSELTFKVDEVPQWFVENIMKPSDCQ